MPAGFVQGSDGTRMELVTADGTVLSGLLAQQAMPVVVPLATTSAPLVGGGTELIGDVTSADGLAMACRFRLLNPARGIDGGGSGRCEGAWPSGGLPVLSAHAALLETTPRLAPGIDARRIDSGGQALWVFRNPATGGYFRTSRRLYILAAGLDGRTAVSTALGRLPPVPDGAETPEALLGGLAAMVAAGPPPAPGKLPRRAGPARCAC